MVKLDKMPPRVPTDGTFEVTLRCNLKCKMCLFRHEDCEFPAMQADELTTEEWIDMARQAAEAGTLHLLITGGEPMMRKDFCELWEGIYQYGFIIELYTNATMVTEKVMETLRKYPPHKIGVTIYGASAETYEKVCGNGAMYEKALQGIRQLMTLPSVLDFRATIIKDNYPDAEAIETLVSETLGYPENLTTTRIVNKSVRGACAKAEECRLEPDDNIRLMHLRSRMRLKQILGEKYDEERYRIEGFVSSKPENEACKTGGSFTLLGCKGGMSEFTITYDGKLQGCQILGVFRTDAKTSGFQTAWEQFPSIVRIPPQHEKCRSCPDHDYCNICPASIYAETGALDGWPEYLCRDTEALKKIINNNINPEKWRNRQ